MLIKHTHFKFKASLSGYSNLQNEIWLPFRFILLQFIYIRQMRGKKKILLKTANKWNALRWFNFEIANVVKRRTAKSIKLTAEINWWSTFFHLATGEKYAQALSLQEPSEQYDGVMWFQSINWIKVKFILWIISDRYKTPVHPNGRKKNRWQRKMRIFMDCCSFCHIETV